jgi:hypothetical protein
MQVVSQMRLQMISQQANVATKYLFATVDEVVARLTFEKSV